jgi:hypothetical protein
VVTSGQDDGQVAAMRCRGCGQPGARRLVELGSQPACDFFPQTDAPGPDPTWPLALWWCPTCALVQLGPVPVLAEEPVLAVESATSREHARRVASAMLAEHPELAGARVREFASHHGGSWLEALAGFGCSPVGGPSDGDGQASLVIDTHALAHEWDVHGALAQRTAALRPDGLLVLEHHHLLSLVQGNQFDTVRHGHWSYLSLTAVQRLGARHGLDVIDAVCEPVFGGSLRAVLAPVNAGRPVSAAVPRLLAAEAEAGLDDGSGLSSFGARALVAARALHAYLRSAADAGRRVLGYGAPSKAAVLLGVSGIGTDLLEFTVDASALKHGRAIPGGRVPIRPVDALVAARPDVVLLLTWDIADEVVDTLERSGGWGAEYLLPLPAPHILDQDVIGRSAVRTST